jgi:hypothetical protein
MHGTSKIFFSTCHPDILFITAKKSGYVSCQMPGKQPNKKLTRPVCQHFPFKLGDYRSFPTLVAQVLTKDTYSLQKKNRLFATPIIC